MRTMPAVFAISDSMVAKVELNLHDIFDIRVLNSAQLRVFRFTSFVRMSNL
jgi:hypothetical protein